MKKYWIITAMEEEAEGIINLLNLDLSKSYENIKIYENKEYVLALTGIWKIQASIWTTILCLDYWVQWVINIWIAWNLRWKEANIWDVYIINQIIQHDMYLPFNGIHLNYAKGVLKIPYTPSISSNDFDFWFYENWICATWDQFIDGEEKCKKLREDTWAHVAEMEAFWVASVAREFWLLNNTIIIKGISDGADTDALHIPKDTIKFAMDNTIEVLKKVIN